MTQCLDDFDTWLRTVCLSMPPGFALEATDRAGTNLNGRARVIAEALRALHDEACKLLPEFHCDTAERTLDSWSADYGLPDSCGLPDLCFKVTYDGGQRCEDFAEIGALYGVDLCCRALDPEIQAGAWNLGCDPMPPAPEHRGGGFDLGVVGLGCPLPEEGSDLGQDAQSGDCNVAGFSEFEEAAVETITAPCDEVDTLRRWESPSPGGFVTGCAEPWSIEHYVGTAYHLEVGIKGSSAILADPSFPQAGNWDVGCASLCAPPFADLLCFIQAARPAHVKVLPVYC